jgi:hypothetical protein
MCSNYSEVEITPRMIEVGANLLRLFTTFYGESEETWAKKIFQRMLEAAVMEQVSVMGLEYCHDEHVRACLALTE